LAAQSLEIAFLKEDFDSSGEELRDFSLYPYFITKPRFASIHGTGEKPSFSFNSTR
jgi:hypothetical protein